MIDRDRDRRETIHRETYSEREESERERETAICIEV